MGISTAIEQLIDRLTGWRRFLAWYPSAVAAVRDDGTIDVIPDDATMRGNGTRVHMLSGTAGVYGLPRVGDRVLLFFAAGDPAQPRALATDARATEALALAAKVDASFAALDGVITGWVPVPNDGGAALKTAYSTAKAQAGGALFPPCSSDAFGRSPQ